LIHEVALDFDHKAKNVQRGKEFENLGGVGVRWFAGAVRISGRRALSRHRPGRSA